MIPDDWMFPDDRMTTMHEAAEEYALNYGRDNPDVCWIVSPFDSIHRNPFYKGPPRPHPDSDYDDVYVAPAGPSNIEDDIPF